MSIFVSCMMSHMITSIENVDWAILRATAMYLFVVAKNVDKL